MIFMPAYFEYVSSIFRTFNRILVTFQYGYTITGIPFCLQKYFTDNVPRKKDSISTCQTKVDLFVTKITASVNP